MAGRLWSAAGPGPSGQELAVAAERTCELRAWRGRPPARPPRRWPRARPPADTVFPRSEHHAHTRSARGGPEARRRLEGRVASIGREQRGKNPTPARARTHRRKPKRNPGRARRFQGPRRACSLEAGEAPSPRAAGAAGEARSPATASHSGDQVARPGLPSPGVRAPGQTQRGSPSAWISLPTPPPVLARTAPSRGAGLAPAQRTGCCPFVQTPWAAPARGQRRGGEPRPAAAGGSREPLCPTPGEPPRRDRGGARGAYLSAAKCPGGFLPV